jgi:predicted HD phosphohydrolase
MRPVVLVLPHFKLFTLAGVRFRIGGKKTMSEIGRWFFEHISDNASSYFLDSFFNLFFIEAAEGFNRTSVSLTGLFIPSTASRWF